MLQHNDGVKRFSQINGLMDREGFKTFDEVMTNNAQRFAIAESGHPKNEMAFKIIATCDYIITMHRT